MCSAIVQAQPQTQTKAAESAPAISDTVGSVTEPQGDAYVAPKKLSPKLARVTLYRPAHGFSSGVAHLEINGQYHTSLQLGGFSEICLEPEDFKLAAHMVQTGADLKNYQDATTTLKPQAAQNLYVRVSDQGDGRATLTSVSVERAKHELQDTRRQIHAVTRVTQAQECTEPAPRVVAKGDIVLGADALFGFGKSDIKDISVQGRAALDALIAKVQKQYGSDAQVLLHITGHADPLGNPVMNKRLSEARAKAIREYMQQGGIDAKRLSSSGAGSEQPVIQTCGKTVTPETIECNKPNRRVVLSIRAEAR